MIVKVSVVVPDDISTLLNHINLFVFFSFFSFNFITIYCTNHNNNIFTKQEKGGLIKLHGYNLFLYFSIDILCFTHKF